jgi:PAS domain S-box-containing protein
MDKKFTYEELERRIRELAQYQSKYSRSERNYLDQKQLLQIVLDELPFWFSVKDKSGKYLLVNKKMAQAHAVPDSAFLDKPIMETPELYAGGLKLMAERDDQVLKTGERLDVPEYPVASSGETRWRRLVKVPWKNETGDILGVISWSEDITERKKVKEELLNYRDHLEELVEQHTAELKRANEQLQRDIGERKQMEAALRESEQKYRSMMEAMDDAVYICSPDYYITYMNAAMLKRVGYNAVGERCHKVMHGLDESCPWCVHSRVMNGEHAKFEVVSPKDNKTYHVSNSPIFHADGSIPILIILRDITKIKEIEAQLVQAQKMESVGRLAGGVAHDYNNALSVIIGYTELMLDEVEQESPLRVQLIEVLKAANNAAGITRQLLAFASKHTVAPRRLELNTNVELLAPDERTDRICQLAW